MDTDVAQTAFRFLLASLACWRVSLALVKEEGPSRAFARLRERAGHGMLGRMLECLKCTGTWVALPFAVFVGGGLVTAFVSWLAIAGVTALIDEWTRPPFEWHDTATDPEDDSERAPE
jgi:hypothetical protein